MIVYGFVYEWGDRRGGLFAHALQYNYFYQGVGGYLGEARNRTLPLDKENRIMDPLILPIGWDLPA